MRIQGKLTTATPTQNMKRMMRMVRTQLMRVSSKLYPWSFIVTRMPRVPMIRVTRALVVTYITLRPYLTQTDYLNPQPPGFNDIATLGTVCK